MTKEEFIEVVTQYGYNIDDASNYMAIYLDNTINADNLIAWLDVERKRGGCYDVRLQSTGDICTKDSGRTLASKKALINHLKRIAKDTLFWKKQYKLRLIKLIGQNE